MTILTITDLLGSITIFLKIFLACFFACALFFFIVAAEFKNFSFTKGNRYNFVSQMNREALKMIYKGMDDKEILSSLRQMKFGFMLYPAGKDSKSVEFARRVLGNDDLMYRFVIVPVFDSKTFRALSKEVKDGGPDGNRIKATTSLNYLLKDRSDENRANVENLMVKILSSSPDKLDPSGERPSTGKVAACLMLGLLKAGVIKESSSQSDYVSCLKALKTIYPEMKIIKSKSSISYSLDRIKDPTFLAVSKEITDTLKVK